MDSKTFKERWKKLNETIQQKYGKDARMEIFAAESINKLILKIMVWKEQSGKAKVVSLSDPSLVIGKTWAAVLIYKINDGVKHELN